MAFYDELGGQGVECRLLRERALERWSGGRVRHQHKATLKSLDLSGHHKLGDKGWIAIAKSLEVNATLTSLQLQDKNLDKATKDKLCHAAKSTLTLYMR